MKEELEKIYREKNSTMNKMISGNNMLIATVYKGLAKDKPIREIHKEIRDVYIKIPIKDEKILNYCLKVAQKGKRIVEEQRKSSIKQGNPIDFSLLAFDFIHQEKPETKTMHYSYKYTQVEESHSKEIMIQKMLKRDLENRNIVYLCSWHRDVALDHAAYQGKYYINEHWESIVKTDELKQEIRKWIKNNDVKTFQWVVGPPVYMLTRPNCRHYFKVLSIQEAMHNSAKFLIAKYDLRTDVGDRRIQTLKSRASKEKWQRTTEIKNTIRTYERRLRFHKLLYKQSPNQKLESWIGKDVYLIKYWKKKLKEIEKD